MASGLLRLGPSRFLIGVPLGISLSLPLFRSNPSSVIRCDYGPPGHQLSSQATVHPSQIQGLESNGNTTSSSRISATTARKMSLGSVLGLCVGLGLRVFSRPLAFSIGLTILVIEWAASKGYHIFPTRWLQRYIKSVDVRRAMTENIPFKATFGTTMILAAFANFDAPQDGD